MQSGPVGVRIGAAALVGALLAVSAPLARAGTQDPAAARLVDGEWTGALDYAGDAAYGGGSSVAGGAGTLTIAVSGGRAEGTFSFLGMGSSAIPGGGSAQLTFGGEGVLSGDADGPVLEPTTASFTGEASVGGITVPVDFSGPLDAIPLHITSASCNQVNGTYAQESQATVNAQGIAATFTGFFSVVRSKVAPPGTADTLNAILNELDALLSLGTASGGLAYDAIAQALHEAEDFAASLPGGAKCGLPGTDTFQLALSTKVAAVLEQILSVPGVVSTEELTDLMYLGVEAGAIGAGAPDQATSKQLLADLEAELGKRLQAALAADDAAEIEAVKIAAVTFGFSDLIELAGGT